MAICPSLMARDVQNVINLSTFLSSWSSASSLKSLLKVKFLSQGVVPRYKKATITQTRTHRTARRAPPLTCSPAPATETQGRSFLACEI